MRRQAYIASGLANASKARDVRRVLENCGWGLTYDWTQHGLIEAKYIRPLFAVAETNGVRRADVLITVLPGGRGTHTELGIALGLSKPVILYAPDPGLLEGNHGACLFYFHPLVYHVRNDVELKAALETIELDLEMRA